MNDDDALQVAATGVHGPLTLENALYMAKRASRIAPVQVVRAQRVLGWDHVRSAAMHASRALAEGRQQADRPEVEFSRFLAGRRQIKAALEWVGLGEENDAAAVIAFGEHRLDALAYFVDSLGLRDDDELLNWTEAKQESWGLNPEKPDAILQEVAAVDLMRS